MKCMLKIEGTFFYYFEMSAPLASYVLSPSVLKKIYLYKYKHISSQHVCKKVFVYRYVCKYVYIFINTTTYKLTIHIYTCIVYIITFKEYNYS